MPATAAAIRPIEPEAALLAALAREDRDGHTITNAEHLMRCALESAGGSLRSTERDLARLVANGDIAEIGRDWVGLPARLETEKRLRRLVKERAGRLPSVSFVSHGQALDKSQTVALEQALSHRLFYITGGPGTGKSTIASIVVRTLVDKGLVSKPACMALPARIARVTGDKIAIPSTTIHRGLEWTPDGFQRTQDRPLDIDFLLVEEAAMIGNELLLSLLLATPPACRILFIGDAQQIAPIGSGRPVDALSRAGIIPAACLMINHRSGAGSTIPDNGRRVLFGKSPIQTGDLSIIRTRNALETQAIARDVLLEFKDAWLTNSRMLTAGHQGAAGTLALNEAWHGRRHLEIGDEIMQTVNDDERDFLNGETAIVTAVTPSGITAETSTGRAFTYPKPDAKRLIHCKAMTFHKAQGLEFDAVAVVLDPDSRHLTRSMIHVGITRAKQRAVIIDQQDTLSRVLANKRSDVRRTSLML